MRSLNDLDTNPVFKDSFTGFVLFDPEKNDTLFNHQGAKYFTPASNTKLFTFYVANRILDDSLVAFRYQLKGDSIWLWGTGDPSFLNPDLPKSKVYEFLSGKNIHLVRDKFDEPVYGPGWAWDDYSGSYQRVKASFPIYSNAVNISWDSVSDQAVVSPYGFADSVSFGGLKTSREISSNQITVSDYWLKKDTLSIPIYGSPSLFQSLWSDTLSTPVNWVDHFESTDNKKMHSIPADSAYKRMLQISDNFIAEQLILQCSYELFGELNSSETLKLLADSLLSDLPQVPIWIDGSGLSRYNLFTPQSVVVLLHKIYQEVGMERIRRLFPAGGTSGTIEKYYQSDPPYIYAKTGTLRNNHTLSGYLIAESGRTLIFSFMHNHYITGSSVIKNEMEKLLDQIRMKY